MPSSNGERTKCTIPVKGRKPGQETTLATAKNRWFAAGRPRQRGRKLGTGLLALRTGGDDRLPGQNVSSTSKTATHGGRSALATLGGASGAGSPGVRGSAEDGHEPRIGP